MGARVLARARAASGRWPLPCALVLLGGWAFVSSLQRLTPEGVFYNGDGGTKYLLARQYAAGQPGPDLRFEGPVWAQTLWRSGLQPLGAQFVFQRAHRFLIAFPFTFPWASATALEACGWRGLLLLPGLATFCTWLLVLWTARRVGASNGATVVALALAVFGTPLAVYGAIFWEHAPAVTLALASLALLSSARRRAPAPAAALLAGLLASLSVALREEQLALVAVLGLLALAPWVRSSGRLSRAWRALGWPRAVSAGLLVGLVLGLGVYLAMNLTVYGSAWGVRDVQMPAGYWWQRPRVTGRVLAFLLPAFAHSFPLVYLAPLAWWIGRGGRGLRWPRWARRLLFVAVAFTLLVAPLPLIPGGKQVGARYLLLLYPLGALLAGQAWAEIWRAWRAARLARAPAFRPTLLVVSASLLTLLSVRAGTWQAPRDLGLTLYKRALAVEHLRADPQRTVAVSHPFIAQQLAWYIGPRLFFLTRRGADIKALAEAQVAAGEPVGFTYLCNPAYACPGFEHEPRQRVFTLPHERTLVALRQPDVGPYLRWHVLPGAPGLARNAPDAPDTLERPEPAMPEGLAEPDEPERLH